MRSEPSRSLYAEGFQSQQELASHSPSRGSSWRMCPSNMRIETRLEKTQGPGAELQPQENSEGGPGVTGREADGKEGSGQSKREASKKLIIIIIITAPNKCMRKRPGL